jgi:hypothetical protein
LRSAAADAGIPWYLSVEPKAPRSGCTGGSTHYLEVGTTEPGEILHLSAPVRVDLDPSTLLP